jgi:hypothetical protein
MGGRTKAQDGEASNRDKPASADIIRAFCEAFQPPGSEPRYKSNITLFSQFPFRNPALTFKDKGFPLSPVFGVGNHDDDDKKMARKYSPPERLTGKVNFSVAKEIMPIY